MRYSAFLILGLLALLVASVFAETAAPLSSSVIETKVTVFQPAVPKGKRHSGHCWTGSAAVDRAGAWRCIGDNSIYDPCFSNAKLKNAVVCGIDPSSGKPGFVLTLTKPLPRSTFSHQQDPFPWMLKLADGSTCELSTGTIASVGGTDLPYECSDSHECTNDGCPYMTGVSTNIRRAKVWIAEKVAFKSTKSGLELIKRVSLPVVAVWK